MDQENEKTNTNKDVGRSRTNPVRVHQVDQSGGDSEGKLIRDKQLDAEEEELAKDEVFYKAAEDMPGLKDDQEMWEDEQLCLDFSLSPEILEYAKREIGETEEIKCQMLQELRDMIYERGECLPHRMDDGFLIRFLRARNFNLKRAHRLVVNYYNFKEGHPEIHQQMETAQVRIIGDDDVITVPPYRTQCGRRVIIYRIGNWDPSKYSIEELFKATVTVLELGILEPKAQILGGFVIFDLKNITLSHAWTVTPQIASMMLSLMVTAFPIKAHAIHILHQSWIFDAIFAVFKPLLDSNMRNRVFFHGSDFESLHKHILPAYLPKMYGGVRNELPYYKWIQSLIKDPRVIEEMDKMGYIITDEIREIFDMK